MRRFGTQGPVNPQEHYVVSRPKVNPDARTASASLALRVSRSSTTTGLSPPSISKTTSISPALPLNRSKNYLDNIQRKSGKPFYQR